MGNRKCSAWLSSRSDLLLSLSYTCFMAKYNIHTSLLRLYTVKHKKHTKIFYHNFYNTWPILIEIDMQCLG